MAPYFILLLGAVFFFCEVYGDCKTDTLCSAVIRDSANKTDISGRKNKLKYLNDVIFEESSKNFVFENLTSILKAYELKHNQNQKQGTKIRVYDLSDLINDLDYNNGEDSRTPEVTTEKMNKEDAKIQDINQRIQKINEKLLNPRTEGVKTDSLLKVIAVNETKLDSKEQNKTKPREKEEKETKKIKKIKNKFLTQLIKENNISKGINFDAKVENNDQKANTDLKTKVNGLKHYDYPDDMPLYDAYSDEAHNASDYPNIDYIELYRDVTNQYVPIVTVTENVDFYQYWNNMHLKKKSVIDSPNFSCHDNETKPVEAVIYPWIAAIFVKNSSHDQFTYVCDGALVSEKAVLTAARCLDLDNGSINASDIIVVLGKKSLQASDANEKFYRIQKVIKHENFSSQGDKVTNDLAVLLTETPVTLTDHINSACLSDDEEMENSTVIDAMTTGWKVTGELTTIPFSNNGTECGNYAGDVTSVCNSYGNDIIFCPSHGGLYLIKLSNNKWYLNGIRSSDTSEKTICTNWNLKYTQLQQSLEWIKIYS